MSKGARNKLWGSRWARVGLAVVLAAVAGIGAFYYWAQSEPAPLGGPPTARLISSEQYINAVENLFGDDIPIEANFALPQRRYGLMSLGAADMVMTPGLFDQFDRTARNVATQIMDEKRRDMFVPCKPRAADAPDDACAGSFFIHVGRFLYRRPLSQAERALYVRAAGDAAANSRDFYAGLSHGLAAMLVSPQFLFFTETLEPDPDARGRYRLDAWSKATRLSLFLWNSLPDTRLLRSAETGKLHESAEVQRQVTRMMAESARLERGVRAFFGDLLLFDRFATLTKDPVIYPAVTPQVVLSAQEQALRMVVDQLLTRRADYRDLFTTSNSFVDAALAPLERLPTDGADWQPVTLDPRMSSGLLTSVGFLAVHSHPGRSSPTLRGKAIREAILCQQVPVPPPNVDFKNFEASQKTVKTARERLSLHSTDAVCAGCHRIMDPLGLAFENFDGAGQFRERENGAPIDTSGALDGRPFTDVQTFGQTLHSQPALASCLTGRLYAHGTGREPRAVDRPSLAYFAKHFASDGYRYPDLLRRIAVSRAFYAVTMPERPVPQRLARADLK